MARRCVACQLNAIRFFICIMGKTMKHLIFTLIAASLLVTSQLAFAATETYVMHASACSTFFSPNPDNIQFGVPNEDTVTAEGLLCPFVIHNYSGITDASLWVHGYDRNADADLGCTVVATDLNGTFIASHEKHLSTAPTKTAQHFTVALKNLDPAVDKIFYVTCNIPGVTAMGISYLTSLALTVTTADYWAVP